MKARRVLASRFSLRLRLSFLAAAAAAVVLTCGALLLYGGMRSALDDAVTAELRVRADDLANELSVGVPLTEGGALVAQVLDAQGNVLHPSGEDPVADSADIASAAEEIVVDREIPRIGRDARLLVRPARPGEPESELVAVAGSTAPIKRAERRLAVVLGVAGPVMLSGVATMAWILTGAALRPVARMTRRAETISLRDPEARLPQPPGRDEIARLGRTLNTMLSRIAETVAHERAFVDDASHELRGPLAVLRGELELARMEIEDGGPVECASEAIESALEETDRLTALAEHLLVLARAEGGLVGSGVVELADIVRQCVARADPAPPISIDLRLADAEVVGDSVALTQLVTNVLDNAVHWARARVAVGLSADGDQVVLEVADDGPGFASSILDRAFERFSRPDPARDRSGGAGLGLAIVAAVARAHGGSVMASNGLPLGGALVRIRLPAAGDRVR